MSLLINNLFIRFVDFSGGCKGISGTFALLHLLTFFYHKVMKCKPVIKKSSHHKNSGCSTNDDELNTRDRQYIPEKFIRKKLDMEKILKENSLPIYAYVLTTADYNDVEKKIIQGGNSPNFEGGIATLCCCKHYMRTYPKIQPDVWIAGFTTRAKTGKNYLFFLAKIEDFKCFFYDLEKYLNLKKGVDLDAKSTLKSNLGDIYIAKKGAQNHLYKSKWYNEPCYSHVHFNGKKNWKWDIETPEYKKHHKLLIFDIDNTFVWEEPTYFSKRQIPRGDSKFNTNEFITNLQPCKK